MVFHLVKSNKQELQRKQFGALIQCQSFVSNVISNRKINTHESFGKLQGIVTTIIDNK